MADPFIGSEALKAGNLTPYALRSRFVAMYPGVYIAKDARVSAITRAKAGFLWTRRHGVAAGRSAAALHHAKWVSAGRPAQILCANRRAPRGIEVWSNKVADDEMTLIDGVRATTPARTALDIACRFPIAKAVAAIDALGRATHLKTADVELLAARYKGRRGIRQAFEVLDLVDPGAESPKETWLRLLVIRHGFPRPQTQIPIYNEYGVRVAKPDMGWEELKLALDYDGEHHRDAAQFNKDIRRHDALMELGWTDIRVTSLDTEAVIIARLTREWARRT